MTCIVGVVHGGQVFIGGDSAATSSKRSSVQKRRVGLSWHTSW
jgi:hypothetical protein